MGALSTDQALLAEFEAEKPARELNGIPKHVVAAVGVGLSCYALFWVLDPIPALIYRASFIALALAMTFMVYRARSRSESVRRETRSDNPGWADYVPATLALASLLYPVIFFAGGFQVLACLQALGLRTPCRRDLRG